MIREVLAGDRRLVSSEQAGWIKIRFSGNAFILAAGLILGSHADGRQSEHSALFGCVANEGRFSTFVAPEDADQAIALLQRHAVTSAAAMIGKVSGGPAG